MNFVLPGDRLVFTKLSQAFIKTQILNHFDLEYYICIKNDVLGYATNRVFSHLTWYNLGKWHTVAFFSRKIILAETGYETYNIKLKAIIEAFKITRHYLEGYRHKILVFTNLNNLHIFMNIKNMSFRQVCWIKSCLDTIFRLIIVKIRPIRPLILFLNTFNIMLKKKLASKPKKPLKILCHL